MLTGQVERDVSEPVDVQNGGADPVRPDFGLGQVEPRERVRIERRPELRRLDAEREMRGRR